MFESPNKTYLSGTVSATAGATFAAADASGNVSSIMTVPSDMNMSNAMLFYCGSDVSSVGLYSGGTYSGGTMNADGYATGGTLSGGSSVSFRIAETDRPYNRAAVAGSDTNVNCS